ncbi:MAG: hypothetical protein ACFFCI_23840 [Promethearchaeota archaeon]
MKKEFKQKASKILSLKDNWDGQGSSSYKKTTIERAERFLKSLLRDFIRLYNIELDSPYIFPGIDGEIDLEWKSTSYQLLISIPESIKELAGAYGDDYGKDKLKIMFNPDVTNVELIAWLGRQF